LPGFAKNNSHSINGTLRFEAILPNISLKIKEIKLKPILSTKLSIKLLNHENKSDICPQIGYLTLSESGFLVPLLENDFDVLTVPIVGVWTCFDSNDNNGNTNNNNNNNDNNHNDINNRNNRNEYNNYDNNDNDTNNDYNNTNDIDNQTNKNYKSNKNNHDNNHNIKNPLTWAICVRFLYSKHIKDKRYAPDGSFVLVIDTSILYMYTYVYICIYYEYMDTSMYKYVNVYS
jgi:hypothetical protein